MIVADVALTNVPLCVLPSRITKVSEAAAHAAKATKIKLKIFSVVFMREPPRVCDELAC